MYLLGSRLLELFPYVAVTGNIAVIIACSLTRTVSVSASRSMPT